MANYRIKEKNGLFTIEVELKRNCKALRFKNKWVQSDTCGRPISAYNFIEFKTYFEFEDALQAALYLKSESEKEKSEEIKYHYLN